MRAVLVRNTADRFGVVAKLFHWSIALLITGLIWLGWYMVDLNYYHRWYNDSLTAHKSLGVIVLAFAAAKLLWSWYSPTPALVPTLRAWERILARAMHALLVAAMFILPITGYVISTSEGDAVAIFDWFAIPAVVVVNEDIRDTVIGIHYYTSYATAVLVALHAGAAMKHQFIDGDGTLRRMM